MNSKLTKPHYANNHHEHWFDELRQKVNVLVKSGDKRIKTRMHFKAATLFACYLTFYYLLIFHSYSIGAMFAWYVLLGMSLIIFFLNTAHDIVHNSFFSNHRWNERMLVLLDIIGDNSLIWKRRHVHYHHVYSNVRDWDMDIRQLPLVRILPQAKYRWFHRFQHIYMPFLYLFYTIHVSYYRDFYDLYSKEGLLNKTGIRDKMNVAHFYIYKLVNLLHLLFIPILLIPQAWYWVVAGFVAMHMAGSILAAIALVSAHVGEEAVFVKTNEEKNISHSWIHHQLLTTTDFATGNKFLTELYGGFNHHVAHHLFPSISHGHYPLITRLIVEADRKNELGYKCIGLGKALLTHFHLLRNNSKPMDIFEE